MAPALAGSPHPFCMRARWRPGRASAHAFVFERNPLTCRAACPHDQAILKDKEDQTRLRLIFANQSEADILLRPQLDAFALDPRFEVHYVLSRPADPKAWCRGSVGRVCEEMIRAHLFPPSGGDDSLALMCGPPGMQDAAMAHLEKWGYDKAKVVVF